MLEKIYQVGTAPNTFEVIIREQGVQLYFMLMPSAVVKYAPCGSSALILDSQGQNYLCGIHKDWVIAKDFPFYQDWSTLTVAKIEQWLSPTMLPLDKIFMAGKVLAKLQTVAKEQNWL